MLDVQVFLAGNYESDSLGDISSKSSWDVSRRCRLSSRAMDLRILTPMAGCPSQIWSKRRRDRVSRVASVRALTVAVREKSPITAISPRDPPGALTAIFFSTFPSNSFNTSRVPSTTKHTSSPGSPSLKTMSPDSIRDTCMWSLSVFNSASSKSAKIGMPDRQLIIAAFNKFFWFVVFNCCQSSRKNVYGDVPGELQDRGPIYFMEWLSHDATGCQIPIPLRFNFTQKCKNIPHPDPLPKGARGRRHYL
jgi:hypothetical protein